MRLLVGLEKLELWRDYWCRLCNKRLFKGSWHYGSWSKAREAMIFYCDECYEKNKDIWKLRHVTHEEAIANREIKELLSRQSRDYFIKKET